MSEHVATCKDCLHYDPCFEYGNVLDPLHGGVKCDSFKAAADVVEVVRCKDCKYWQVSVDGIHTWCSKRMSMATSKDDFCSYGAKMDLSVLCSEIECEPPYGGKEVCELYKDGFCGAKMDGKGEGDAGKHP